MTSEKSIERIALNPAEAAEALGVSEMTVLRRLRDGILPAKKLGNRWLISVDALRQFVGDVR